MNLPDQIAVELRSRDLTTVARDLLDTAEAHPDLVRQELSTLVRARNLLNAAIEKVEPDTRFTDCEWRRRI